jgi:hypothetical protein
MLPPEFNTFTAENAETAEKSQFGPAGAAEGELPH